MTILKYDYIYENIIKFILNHFYIYSISNYTKNYYLINLPIPISFNHFNNEIINISLVSMKWFDIISYILTNEIMNFHNYIILKQFTIQKEITTPNESYNLIKLNNSIKIYKSLQDYESDYEKGRTSNYRKILVELASQKYENVEHFLMSTINYPDNVQFALNIQLYDHNVFNEFRNKNGEQINNIFKKKIYRAFLCYYKREISNEFRKEIFEIISSLDPKYIELNIYREDDGDDYDEFYTHIKDTNILTKNKSLKSIQLKNDYFEPFDYLSIKFDESNITTLHLNIPFIQMMKIISGKSENRLFFNHPNTLLNNWNELVNGIVKLKLLNYLSIYNYGFVNEKIDNKLMCTVTQGIKTILSNQNCKIQTLNLKNIKFIDDLFIDALNLNTSISLLIFHQTDPTLIFEKVLTNNKSIKNLYFNAYTSNDLFKLFNIIKKVQLQIQQQLQQQQQNNNDNIVIQLFNKIKINLQQQYNNNIELDSITISSYEIDEQKLKKIINEITTHSFQIREYNIFISDKTYTPKQQQIILTNGTIINIINNKNYKGMFFFKH